MPISEADSITEPIHIATPEDVARFAQKCEAYLNLPPEEATTRLNNMHKFITPELNVDRTETVADRRATSFGFTMVRGLWRRTITSYVDTPGYSDYAERVKGQSDDIEALSRHFGFYGMVLGVRIRHETAVRTLSGYPEMSH